MTMITGTLMIMDMGMILMTTRITTTNMTGIAMTMIMKTVITMSDR